MIRPLALTRRVARRIVIAAVAVALVVVATTLPASAGKAPAPDRAGTLNISISVPPTTWDPLLYTSPLAAQEYLMLVYDQLVEYGPGLEVQPMLATKWTNAADGMSMTLKLRDDVKFRDGTPVDAAAVKANLERAMSVPAMKGVISTLQSVTANDATTVTLTFSSTTYNFVDVLANDVRVSSMANPAAFNDALRTTPAGSGPYDLVTASQQGARLQRAANHWDRTAGLAREINIQVIADATARLSGLQSGQFDFVTLGPDQFRAAQGANVRLVRFDESSAIEGLLLNYKRPALSDWRVRKAMSLALDRRAIADAAYDGRCRLTQQLFNSSTSGWVRRADSARSLRPDVEAARALMRKAGVDKTTLDILVPAGFVSLTNVGQLVQQQLAPIGITVNLIPVSAAGSAQFADGGADGYITSAVAAVDSQLAINANLLAKGRGFGAPEGLESLIESAARTPLGAGRDAAYQRLGEALVERPAHLPICNVQLANGASTRLVGTERLAYAQMTVGIIDSRRLGVAKTRK